MCYASTAPLIHRSPKRKGYPTVPRPDPDALLQQVEKQAQTAHRGKLKIFLGAAPGVGKTYAMLLSAHQRRLEGKRVLVGILETHGRSETANLLEGLEILPRRRERYHNTWLEEFDLEAALQQHPDLLLVDELAHTNLLNARHQKRHQDIQELLEAGIDVYTTVNIQHLESLRDIVLQFTGVQVRETIPDRVLDEADEIELIDLPPEELTQRMRDGKIYDTIRAERALQHFFTRGNLLVLRELTLRRAAQHVGAEAEDYRRQQAPSALWPAASRILVCISPSPSSEQVIRTASRLAQNLKGQWFALYVETPRDLRLSSADQERLLGHLRLAEQLGAQSQTLSSKHIAGAVLQFAKEHRVTMLLAGKPTHPRWQDRIFGSFLDEIIRGSGDIAVHLVTGEEPSSTRPHRNKPDSKETTPRGYGYLVAGLVVALCTLINLFLYPWVVESDLIMIYLLGLWAISSSAQRKPALLAALLSTAAFNFFFIPPFYTFAVADSRYLLTFTVMTMVGVLWASLSLRVRLQAEYAEAKAHQMALLFRLTRHLASAATQQEVAEQLTRSLAAELDTPTAFWLYREHESQPFFKQTSEGQELTTQEEEAAAWAHRHQKCAGQGTSTLPAASFLCVPAPHSKRFVLGFRPPEPRWFEMPAHRHIIETLLGQAELALDRVLLAEASNASKLFIEREQVRNSLLSSVSHDLRTPLATLLGLSGLLMDSRERLSPAQQQEIEHSIHDELERLSHIVQNLLEMTRIENSTLNPNSSGNSQKRSSVPHSNALSTGSWIVHFSSISRLMCLGCLSIAFFLRSSSLISSITRSNTPLLPRRSISQ